MDEVTQVEATQVEANKNVKYVKYSTDYLSQKQADELPAGTIVYVQWPCRTEIEEYRTLRDQRGRVHLEGKEFLQLTIVGPYWYQTRVRVVDPVQAGEPD